MGFTHFGEWGEGVAPRLRHPGQLIPPCHLPLLHTPPDITFGKAAHPTPLIYADLQHTLLAG